MAKLPKKVKVRYTAYSPWYTRAFGCLLPSGNSDEFPHIRKNLKALGVTFSEVAVGRGGGRWFVFPETERRKLPSWERERFLPASEDGKTGHGIYHVTVFQLANLLKR